MTPIERQFAELVGRVLGRRWFVMQQTGNDADEKIRPRSTHLDGADKSRATVNNKPKRRYNKM